MELHEGGGQILLTLLKLDTDPEAGGAGGGDSGSEGGGAGDLDSGSEGGGDLASCAQGHQRKLRNSTVATEFLQYEEGWETRRLGERGRWWSFNKRRMLTSREFWGRNWKDR